MVYRIAFLLVLITGSVVSTAQQKAKPVSIIFDSDMGPDYDDAGAINYCMRLQMTVPQKFLQLLPVQNMKVLQV